ncbi:MAG: PadR family transcriptional regulator [Sedimentisphaerales bacterium]|nr:PadR family transcriptional regulator [Sedimentisphaerales bacterium]
MAKDNLPTNREAVILDILTNGERAGRDIRNEYESRTHKKMPLGSLYTTLTRMETSGFVESRTGNGKPERRGYPRKFFSITGTGERILNIYQTFINNAFGGLFQHG